MRTVQTTGPAALCAALRAAQAAGEAFLLVCAPGTVFAPGMLAALETAAAAAPPQTAALAARVLPDGFAWHCDPVTLEAVRLDLDGVALRCAAVQAVGGFDKRLGGAAAAADLCRRLRGAGYTLLYCPQIEAWRDAPAPDGLPAYVESVVGSCRLAARYGRLGPGLRALRAALQSPRHYPGVRKALLRAAPGAVSGALAAAARPASAAARRAAGQEALAPARGICPLTRQARAALAAKAPLATVVVRTCARPDTLRGALKCLCHQTYKNFEVVVVEDGAPTAGPMLGAEFAGLPLRYHATGQHVGRGRAGNIGIGLARGEYVCFLDDDDFFYPDFLELHLAALASGQTPGFVLGATMAQKLTVESKSPYRCTVKERFSVIFDHITLMDMCVRCRVPSSGGMFRRELALRVGGMREDLDGDEDWAMWLRLWAADGRRRTVPEVPRATSLCAYPADPAVEAARAAAYAAFDAQMLADPALVFTCPAEEAEGWRRTVAADMAHLAAHGGVATLAAEAARHAQADIGPVPQEGVYTLTAQQINRYYWYLVTAYAAAGSEG